jgi:hypothetical protein
MLISLAALSVKEAEGHSFSAENIFQLYGRMEMEERYWTGF